MSPLPWIFRRLRRYSSGVRAELTKICAVLLGLVVCAAAQDMSPAVFGAKPPFLLMFGCFAGIPAGIGAGLFTDALGGLPFGCSAVFCAMAALVVRALKSFAIPAAVLAAVAYQLWITLWGGGGNALRAMPGALLASALLAPATLAFIRLARRRIGIDARKEKTR